MRSQNRKVKDIGRVSCVGLLALGLALINPVAGDSVSAVGEDEPVVQNFQDLAVSIAFSPTAGAAQLTPVTSAGAKGLISVKGTVNVSQSGGYSVYLGSDSTNLVGLKTAQVIPGISGVVSYENIQPNTWGYYAGTGSAIPEDAQYKAVAQGRGHVIFENTDLKIENETQDFVLGFAANVDNTMPADTYQNTVTLSVVSAPMRVAVFGITTMQEMTAAVCGSAVVGDTDQLKDVRDGNYYWVRKMEDGKCWMAQNLALDLGTTWPDAALSDYDVANTLYKPVRTATAVNVDSVESSDTSMRSWDLGNYVIAEPETAHSCGTGKAGLADCPEQFVDVNGKIASSDPEFYAKNGQTVVGNEYDAHYLAGNYYTWNVATAGYGVGMESGQANSSICPKGWKLPDTATDEGFKSLVSMASIGSNVAKFTGNGYFFVRAGFVGNSATLFALSGDYGRYWTSVASTWRPDGPDGLITSSAAEFAGSDKITLFGGIYRFVGNSVRCVAR